jgi:tripartite-type tricarboxylate transporter receptor subunit TctC
MKTSPRHIILTLTLAAIAATVPALVNAQQPYPSKPIRIITSTAGGPYDIAMRGLSGPLSQSLGQPFIIENRTGGSFIPLAEGCAHATPDGHTLCTSDSFAQSLNPLLFSKLPYDTKEFAPIIFIGTLNSVVLVNAALPARNIQELFDMARAKPDSISFATAGPGSGANIYVEYLRREKSIAFLNVPYKNFLQGMAAAATGEVNVATFAVGAGLAQAKGGKVRALATTGTRRSIFAPDLPTISEAGVDIAVNTWIGMMGPSGLPREIIMRLNAEYKKVLADKALVEKFVMGQGFEPTPPSGGSPEEFASFIRADQEAYARAIRIVGIKPE